MITEGLLDIEFSEWMSAVGFITCAWILFLVARTLTYSMLWVWTDIRCIYKKNRKYGHSRTRLIIPLIIVYPLKVFEISIERASGRVRVK